MTGGQPRSEPPDPTGDPDAVRQTFEQMPMIMGGFDGPAHVFDATNAAYRQWLGRENVIGLSAPDVFPELIGQQLFEQFDQVMATGTTSSLQEWRFQFDNASGGGLVEVFLDVVIAPRRNRDGATTGITLWGANVTDRVERRRATERDVAEAQQRYQAARDVVIGLQRALLPADVPILPGLDIAARYLVASRDQAAGGDWFDAVPLTDGAVALVVGDIVGHGVAASSAMGQLRSVLAAALSETADLPTALGWADRAAARSPEMRAATACVVVVDPESGAIQYATCGHPAPLVVEPDGSTRLLPLSGGGPLGTGAALPIRSDGLRSGAVLLLYTDGLIERAGRNLHEGTAMLERIAGHSVGNRAMPLDAGMSTVERVCRQSVEMMTRLGYDDDVTALAVQRRPDPIRPLRQELDATPGAVTVVHDAVRQWLTPLGLPTREQLAVEFSVDELVANSVEHAYPPGQPGLVRVRLDLSADGVLRVDVGDDGTWQEPAGPKDRSGRGLWMVGATMDELRLDHARVTLGDVPSADAHPAGTSVRVGKRLRRPATLASESHHAAPDPPVRGFAVEVNDGPPRVLMVSGPVDVTTAEAFADRLDVVTRGGVHPVVVDLGQVTVLSSAGVRVLLQARDAHADHGHDLTLVTMPGSLVHSVLNLVGLAQRARM